MDAFKSIGSFMGGGGGQALQAGNLGMGLLSNIMGARDQGKERDFLMQRQRYLASLSPQDISQMALSATKPIDEGLRQSIFNSVQGDMAQRGLSQAPGIFAASESQALAPYFEQNYRTALDQVMRQLQMPQELAYPLSGYQRQPTDLGSQLMWMMLRNQQQRPAPSGNLYSQNDPWSFDVGGPSGGGGGTPWEWGF
jgi:hypothetical protein